MPTMAMRETPASANLISRRHTIEVRSLSLLSCKAESQQLSRYLCASEQERANRFHFQADYDRYVVSRAFLRQQLGELLDCDPKALEFQYTAYGKPFLRDSGIEFNLSHSGDWTLFAFTPSSAAGDAKVGVDIEQIRPFYDMQDVARQNFASSEFACWQATPEWDRTEAFYRCWTRKESFIKAIGEGLSCPLDSFEVAVESQQPARLKRINDEEALAADWWMADLPGFTGYAAAVTVYPSNVKDVSLRITEIDISRVCSTKDLA